MRWGDVPDWAYDSVAALLKSLYMADPGTYAHCLRVGELARQLTRDLGMNEYEQKLAELSGILHDIGKMGIEKEILLKPGKLDPKELDIMKSHPVMSAQIIEPLTHHELFKAILPVIRGHHERMDGEGYPDKIIGEKINVFSRIILVVDTYDAMSETRVYRKGLPDDIIYAELKRCSGTQFDPQIVRAFLEAHKTWNTKAKDPETVNKIILKVA